MRWLLLSILCGSIAFAEDRPLTLRQAVERARSENPDVLQARLSEMLADRAVQTARDPFFPKLFAGSGLAYSNGFPMSIEGSAPSIVQARAVASIFDRPARYLIDQAREEARGARLASGATQDDAVLRTVELFLDAGHAAQAAQAAQDQADSAARIEEFTRARVAEGVDIDLEARRGALETARARQLATGYEADRDVLEATLAFVLGYPPGDRVRPVAEERAAPELPETEAAATEMALGVNQNLRKLESDLRAKELQARSVGAARWPRLNLVAQYGLFARFNNYEDFFQRFQRHNGQLGVSFEIPLVLGPARGAAVSQAEIEAERVRLQANRLRGQIALDVQRDYADLRQSEAAREVARLDLDVARESLDLTRARLEEGRASLRDVEQARQIEAQKWLAYYEALHTLDRIRYALLHRTGLLSAALN